MSWVWMKRVMMISEYLINHTSSTIVTSGPNLIKASQTSIWPLWAAACNGGHMKLRELSFYSKQFYTTTEFHSIRFELKSFVIIPSHHFIYSVGQAIFHSSQLHHFHFISLNQMEIIPCLPLYSFILLIKFIHHFSPKLTHSHIEFELILAVQIQFHFFSFYSNDVEIQSFQYSYRNHK
jgi:hypothetical protein